VRSGGLNADLFPTAEPLFIMTRVTEQLTCRLRNLGDWAMKRGSTSTVIC
jgi:hypothetical protein